MPGTGTHYGDCKDVAEADFGLEFDPTLVRGMSYYTGTISRFPWKASAVL